MSGKKERRESESSGGSSSSDEEQENTKPSNDVVLTKYNMAAEIVNTVLKEVIAAAKEGAEVRQLCELGDNRLLELTAKTYKKEKNVQKGISMPTCVSVDNCICHFSPLASEPPVVLKNGQLVKIDLGAHIDGYIATAAHTIVVGASKENKVKDKAAKVVLAAYNAMEASLRQLRPEKELKNTDVTDTISRVTEAYGTKPIENMVSHQIERFKVNGEKTIIQNPTEEQKSKVEKCSFENYEVYAIDVLVSTGEGKAKNLDTRTTVYKKTDDLVYSLKMKASRAFFSEVQQKFGLMPFSLRLMGDEVKAKLGVVECERHGLMQPYQVLYEREGELVAHFKTTVILMPSGILKIAGLPLETDVIESDVKLEDEKLVALLKEPLKQNKKKKKTPAAKAEAATETKA
ncbi:DNA-binding protein [Aphelenchoides avenae]|nr:DNA-binding protein [Aphelenchus avenae]